MGRNPLSIGEKSKPIKFMVSESEHNKILNYNSGLETTIIKHFTEKEKRSIVNSKSREILRKELTK